MRGRRISKREVITHANLDLLRELLEAKADPMQLTEDQSTVYHAMAHRNDA